MTGALLLGVSVLYLGTAISYIIQGNPSMGFAFLCYALANLGIFYGAK